MISFLQVVVLCFAIFFGSWTPLKLWGTPAIDYTTATGMLCCTLYQCLKQLHKYSVHKVNKTTSFPVVRSRSLLSLESPQNFQQAACSWFRHTFFREDLPADPPPAHTPWRGKDPHSGRWPPGLYTAVTPITIQKNNITQNSHVFVNA